MTNIEEYLAGTHPGDAASALRIQSFGPVNGNGFALSFIAMSNRTYTVQVRPALASGTWTNLISVAAAPTNRLLWITNAPVMDASRFYRVAIP